MSDFVSGYVAGAGANNGGGCTGGLGDSWLSIIVILALLFGGWGGGWNRGGAGTDGGVMNNYVLASDFSQMERKIDGVYAGICDSTFALNNSITGGFAAAQQTMTQGFAGLNTGMVQQGYETRLGIQGIGQQMAQCCCDLKGGVADLKYTIGQGNCQLGQTVTMAARDIIDNQNANFRSLHDEIVQNRMEDKNAQIQMLQQQVFQQQLAASQCQQNQYLIGQLRPNPVPSYTVPNPYCCYQQTCGCA